MKWILYIIMKIYIFNGIYYHVGHNEELNSTIFVEFNFIEVIVEEEKINLYDYLGDFIISLDITHVSTNRIQLSSPNIEILKLTDSDLQINLLGEEEKISLSFLKYQWNPTEIEKIKLMKKGACDRVWLLYLQGRLSPVQLLALCKLSADGDKPALQKAACTGD